jgi:hypothetical protein
MSRISLGKPARALLVITLTVVATVIGGTVPVAATVRTSTGPSASSMVDLKRTEISRAFRSRVTTPRAPTPPRTGTNCIPLVSAFPSGNVTTFNELESVSAIFPSDGWAVGVTNTGVLGALYQNLVEHWNGSAWTAAALPNPVAGNNFLTGVAAIDANDVWAAGYGQANTDHTFTYHWNGNSWAAVALPQPSSTSGQLLTGVAAINRSDVWVVGAFAGPSVVQTLAQHWNGSSWTTVSTPNAAGAGQNYFENVFATATSDVWAVGYSMTGSTLSTLVEHWNGTAWSISPSPNPVIGDNVLLNVGANSATDAWAVGYTSVGGLLQTLIERWNGSAWSMVSSPNISSGDNRLFGLVTVSATNAWATGYGRLNNTTAAWSTLVEHWDGSTWTVLSSDNANTGNNLLIGITALPGNDVWSVGGASNSFGTNDQTLTEQFQLPAPTGVTATPGDNSASVSWTAPACNGGFATTGYVVTASDGCAIQASLPASSSPFTFPGLTNGTAFNFTVQAVSASLGAETPSAGSGLVTPAGVSVPKALTACSTKQYQSVNPSWQDIDPSLSVTVTPTANSQALITGNADLWTATPGINQDLGISVDGTLVAWKESGGSGGTYSPNAAAVQTVIALSNTATHIIKLQWKSNTSVPGAQIFAGAGPLHGDSRFSPFGTLFSPTRLSVRLLPILNSVFPVSSNKQYNLPGSDGVHWTDIDGNPSGLLFVPVTVTVPLTAVITGNADLFTGNAGFNQDIAIDVDGTIVAWKESGGSAGIFSPNAAFVQAVVPLTANFNHIVKLRWKTNKPAPSATIFAGAGPLPGTTSYSPTSLTVTLVPTTADLSSATSNSQYQLPGSGGAGWTVMDSTKLQVPVTGVTTPTSYLLTGNADLWTANAGYNQDIGIVISGGIYGSGTLIAWKESGGSAGTFSPNAAYVETMQHLQTGSYTISLVWKTNKQAAGKAIYAAAGPAPLIGFSPTTLTVLKVSSP